MHNLVAHPLLVVWPQAGAWLHERTMPPLTAREVEAQKLIDGLSLAILDNSPVAPAERWDDFPLERRKAAKAAHRAMYVLRRILIDQYGVKFTWSPHPPYEAEALAEAGWISEAVRGDV